MPRETPVVLAEGALEGRASDRVRRAARDQADGAVDAAHDERRPRHDRQVPVHLGLDQAAEGRDQHAAHAVRQPADDPASAFRSWPTSRRCWSTGCRGTTPSAATTTSASSLYNGGTLYIDEGKPTPALIGETLRNLREIAPTIYFNVPKGFEEIANALETDAVLRKTFFSRVRMFFFAGAGLAQPVWDKLDRLAEQECGERIRMLTGLGMTETAPFAICANAHDVKSGHIGLPAPGLELKLVPSGDKTEVRYRGPNVTPGYWRAPEQTAEHFDEEGFYCSGDAAKPMDAGRSPSAASCSTAASPRTSSSRPAPSSRSARCARRSSPPAIRWCRTSSSPASTATTSASSIFPRARRLPRASPACGGRRAARARCSRNAAGARASSSAWSTRSGRRGTGSATRVARALCWSEPPSIDRGEITDKGSINQRAVLAHRDEDVQRLYGGGDVDVILPRAA